MAIHNRQAHGRRVPVRLHPHTSHGRSRRLLIGVPTSLMHAKCRPAMRTRAGAVPVGSQKFEAEAFNKSGLTLYGVVDLTRSSSPILAPALSDNILVFMHDVVVPAVSCTRFDKIITGFYPPTSRIRSSSSTKMDSVLRKLESHHFSETFARQPDGPVLLPVQEPRAVQETWPLCCVDLRLTTHVVHGPDIVAPSATGIQTRPHRGFQRHL